MKAHIVRAFHGDLEGVDIHDILVVVVVVVLGAIILVGVTEVGLLKVVVEMVLLVGSRLKVGEPELGRGGGGRGSEGNVLLGLLCEVVHALVGATAISGEDNHAAVEVDGGSR